jgi:tRNA-splicing ligase RtcB (3'-phosphate/5'-hydroxy nucleic acid ligase)
VKQNELYGQMLGGKAQFWTGEMEVEQEALNQIRNISNLPILDGHIAVMPDVHFGMGATVGSVLPLKAAVIPAAVGVDIGCGMMAVQLSLKASDLPDDLKAVRAQIERDVPVGFNYHHRHINTNSKGLEGMRLQRERDSLLTKFDGLRIMQRIKRFDEKRMVQQIGTLGGGNHFIELCLDTEQNVWVMLHSGSRNVGKTIGEAATEFAKEEAYKRGITMADMNLAWFDEGTEMFEEYVEGMSWAQGYARLNRDLMMLLVLEALKRHLKPFTLVNDAVNIHHNYLSRETHYGRSMWITRKGAVSAAKGQWGIIPGSMGAKSFIVCGKGNEAAYCSCSHGAGRRMSRSKAKKIVSAADFEMQTAGVECRKDEGVFDEAPSAYKDIDAVMEAQSELVEVKATLKQILCVKG